MGSFVTCAVSTSISKRSATFCLAVGRMPSYSAARRALNSSSVRDAAPDGLNVECVCVASDVPISLSAAASLRLCCLFDDMIVSDSEFPFAPVGQAPRMPTS